MGAAHATQHGSDYESNAEPDKPSFEDESNAESEEPEDQYAKILSATCLLAEETNFQFAPKGTREWNIQRAAIGLGLFKPPPKFSDAELITRAMASLYQQHLLLNGERKDYCALMCTLLLVIFHSSNPDDMEISARLLAHLAKDERFERYVRFVRGSVLDPTVKKIVKEITSFWNEILGTGCFDSCARGFNYNNMHHTAVQVSDMSYDNHVPDLFLGFFLQWLPQRLKRLEYSAHNWHENAERSFGYAATLLYSAMK